MKGDMVIRWAAALAVLTLTGIATVISYGHAYELVRAHGESGRTAAALPLTVDGLIATCSLVLLDCARSRRRAPWHAWALLGAGMVATLGANVAHGIAHGWVGGIVGAWPALVAVGSFELLIRLVRDGRGDDPSAVPEVAEPPAEEQPASWVFWPPFVSVERDDQPLAVGDQAVEEPAVPEIEAPVPGVPEVYPEIARPFVAEIQQGRLPSYRTIKKRLQVGQDRAREVRKELAVLVQQ